MFEKMKEDVKAIKAHDPAARSALEIILLYPGYKALKWHRTAQWFAEHNLHFMARYVSQRIAHKTGIEIHPGAKIGDRVCIDHGNGVVIGETTEIGNDVLIYQGVTLGGTGKDVGKRHPTIRDNVLIGSGARVLGPVVIGENSKIAAGAVVLTDVPPNSTVAGVPARVVRIDGEKVKEVDDMDQVHIPDPLTLEISRLEERIAQLESKQKGE